MSMDFETKPRNLWSSQPVLVKEFIHKFKLPQVVKIYDGENDKFQAPSNFSLRQPILLYKVYTCRKIHARALALDDNGSVNPTGPSLIIPDSYQGWLSMVTKDGKTAGFFSSVGEVSRADVTMFLAQDAVVALKATSSGLCRTVISRGQVLKTIGPYEDTNRQNVVLANHGHLHPDVMMYLKCITQLGDPVFLPYSARGRFYCISTPKSHSINHIFLVSNLLRVTQLPVLCRIVSGNRPQIALPFTNVLQLEEVKREIIILGCTLVGNEPVLLEINADSAFSFVRCTDEDILKRSAICQRMCNFCAAEGDRWRQQIRVAHQVFTDPKSKNLNKTPSTRSCQVSNLKSEEQLRKESVIAELEKWIQATPPDELNNIMKFKKSFSCRGSIFPKKFWMFRKAGKLELNPGLEGRFTKNHRSEFFNTVSHAKSKSLKYMTVKIKASKGAELMIGGEKLRLEVQRFPHSDDGYVTSHADDESIYHSICE